MESAELVDMMINGAKPSEVQDSIKAVSYTHLRAHET